MASALDKRCPICLDTCSNAGYVLPCLHRFCFKCIHRWAERKPECPLCKGRVTSIVHSVQADDNFEEVTIRPPVEAFVIIHRRRRAHGGPAIRSSRRPAASQSLTAGFAPSCSVGALQASTWASLFREYPDLLQSLLPWLRGELRQFFGHESWEAAAAEGVIMSSLRLVGLDENALIRLLWLSLRWHTVIFVQKLVDIISMASALDKRCPICLDTCSNAGYVLPCLHRFCFKCIHRWAERKPECPLCKGRVTSIVHSVQADDNFEEVTIRPPVGAFFFFSHERRPSRLSLLRSPHLPVASQLLSLGLVSSAPLGGIHPFLWASLFREHPALLQPVLPWLDRELHLFRPENCQAEVVEDLIISSLRTFGLRENALVLWLQFYLKDRTVMFVRQLIKFTVKIYSIYNTSDLKLLFANFWHDTFESCLTRTKAEPHPYFDDYEAGHPQF
ncbi:E3 ubiquitin-protein ligase Topors-like isoform X1 [Aix galericulata]|nr:E3 ubiquitin-protein ligase Topors-like isoform X1 [Aix galericulata]